MGIIQSGMFSTILFLMIFYKEFLRLELRNDILGIIHAPIIDDQPLEVFIGLFA